MDNCRAPKERSMCYFIKFCTKTLAEEYSPKMKELFTFPIWQLLRNTDYPGHNYFFFSRGVASWQTKDSKQKHWYRSAPDAAELPDRVRYVRKSNRIGTEILNNSWKLSPFEMWKSVEISRSITIGDLLTASEFSLPHFKLNNEPINFQHAKCKVKQTGMYGTHTCVLNEDRGRNQLALRYCVA